MSVLKVVDTAAATAAVVAGGGGDGGLDEVAALYGAKEIVRWEMSVSQSVSQSSQSVSQLVR